LGTQSVTWDLSAFNWKSGVQISASELRRERNSFFFKFIFPWLTFNFKVTQ